MLFLDGLQGSSITYRITVGGSQGKGVFAPNSKHRATVTGEAKEKQSPSTAEPSSDEEHRVKMNWAMRLKRVFNIDITVCRHCFGPVRIMRV